MRKNKILQSPRLKEIYGQKRKAKIKKAGLILIFLLLGVIGLSFLSQIKKMALQDIKISGLKKIEEKDVLRIINQELEGQFFSLFLKRNSFIYPSWEIKKVLIDSFKKINKVEIYKNSLNTLMVQIEEREPFYLLCYPSLIESIYEDCYYLDQAGFIFSKAPYFSGYVYFKFYNPTALTQDPIGQYFIEATLFNRLLNLIEQLSQAKLKSLALILKNNQEYELIMEGAAQAEIGTEPRIFISSESDFEKIVDDLLMALKTEPLASQYQNNYANLLYLDLRFNNKVYYKFKPD